MARVIPLGLVGLGLKGIGRPGFAAAGALGVEARPGVVQKVGLRHGRDLYLGWVSDEAAG